MRLRRLALAFSIFVVGASCARHRTVSTPEGPAVGGAVPHADDAADPAPPALRLSDDVRPTRYALELTIVPEQTAFQGHVAIEATVAKSAKVVWLNATGLDITRASLSGREARVIKANDDFIGLTTDHELSEGPLIIDVAYTGTIDREKSRGIYAEQEGSDWYVYTFFESIDARRALPCFDQPDAKVPWQLTFHVKADHVALANAAVLSETPEANGMKTVVIAESKPMPSYLVAFVVGPIRNRRWRRGRARQNADPVHRTERTEQRAVLRARGDAACRGGPRELLRHGLPVRQARRRRRPPLLGNDGASRSGRDGPTAHLDQTA